MKYTKGNFFNTRDFVALKEANEGVLKWLKRRANGNICQATQKIPALAVEKERAHLRPLRNSIFRKESLMGREERTANEKAWVSVRACGYQVPSRYRNKKVEIYTTEEKLFIFDLFTGKEIAIYRLSLVPGKMISKRAYRREKEKTIEELKTSVRELFESGAWKRFTERTFKSFPRYVRNQSVEAKRSFTGKEIDREILEKALTYCLENDTPGFASLRDTYIHFEKESRLPVPVPVLSGECLGHHEPLKVRQRRIADYEEARKSVS